MSTSSKNVSVNPFSELCSNCGAQHSTDPDLPFAHLCLKCVRGITRDQLGGVAHEHVPQEETSTDGEHTNYYIVCSECLLDTGDFPTRSDAWKEWTEIAQQGRKGS